MTGILTKQSHETQWEWVDSCNWMNDVMCRNISLCNKGKKRIKGNIQNASVAKRRLVQARKIYQSNSLKYFGVMSSLIMLMHDCATFFINCELRVRINSFDMYCTVLFMKM